LVNLVSDFETKLKPIKYSCLGCSYCYGAEAENSLNEVDQLPIEINDTEFEISNNWPVVAGEYYEFCDGEKCPIAVSTLGSVELVEKLRNEPEEGLCIVGKTETGNIGIDKIIKNVISNPTIQHLIIAGNDPKGHLPGASLLSLKQHGVDTTMKIKQAPGRRPVLRNVSEMEVAQFRDQIEMTNMIGCEDEGEIREMIKNTTATIARSQSERAKIPRKVPQSFSSEPVIQASEHIRIKLDKTGYFVIFVDKDKRELIAEFYSNDNTLKGVIKGKNSRSMYLTIIEREWVSLLSYAAYLGKELERAELSLKYNLKFIQDGA